MRKFVSRPEPHLKHDFNTPYVPSFLGHVDDEFKRADEDGDGMISRAEWRKWIGEKERLVRVHNNEKAYLIKETRSLRKALSPVQQQAYEVHTELNRVYSLVLTLSTGTHAE